MSWTVIKELNEKRAAKFQAANEIREAAQKESRDLNAEESAKHDAYLSEVETIGKQLERETRAAAIGEALNKHTEQRQENIGREDTEQRNSFGMPMKDYRKYSLIRAVSLALENRPLDGVEGEVNAELCKRAGKGPRGNFYCPTDLPMSKHQRTILDTTQGSGAIPTILTPNFIEVLRNKVICAQAGATFMPDMTGLFAIPKQTSATTGYWVAEGSPPTASYPVLGQVLFSPKTVAGYTDLSRKFIKESIVPAEDFVRNDLVKVLAISIDTAALVGTGSSNQPLGIVPNLVANASGQILSLGTNGGALDYPTVIELETLVASANADYGKMAYAMNAVTKGYLKSTPKSVSGGISTNGFIVEDGESNGYPIYTTNSLPSNGTKSAGSNLSTMVFGNFESMVFALWGGLDILVDPYTGSNAGTVRIVAMQDIDIEFRHLESFSAVKDIVTVVS